MKRSFLFSVVLLMFISQHLLFSQSTEFELRWQAKRLSKSCFTVTQDQGDKAGAIWWPTKMDLSKDLDLHFVIYLGTKDGGGADGLSFVMHNDIRGMEAKGEVGGGLYFGNHPSKGPAKIEPSVAIELDTYQNAGGGGNCSGVGGQDDPAYDHTAVVYDGNICNPVYGPVKLHETKDNVEDNTCYSSVIEWRPGKGGAKDKLSLYIEGKLRFTHEDYMLKNVFNGDAGNPSDPDNMVYYGFTGSTGGLSNEQTICIFEGNSTPVAKDDFASTAFETTVDIDVQLNDKDEDGDPLYTTQILVAPKNGTAKILNKDKIQYSPNPGYAGLDSLQYRVCDIDPAVTGGEKCYANCTNAWVRFNQVECPTYTLEVKKLNENEKCDDALADNGSAEAYMWDGTNKITSYTTFKWYSGNYLTAAQVSGLTPYHVGTVADKMKEGIYTVFAQYQTCDPQIARITINRQKDPPVFTVVVKKSVTQCNPLDGEAEVKLTDPFALYSDYSYKWYTTYPGTSIASTKTLSGVAAGTYIVRVTHTRSGCVAQGSVTISNEHNLPAISFTSTPRTSCNIKNGKLKANVAGNTSNYTFYWAEYNDPGFLNEHKGSAYSDLDTGRYWLKAKDKVTKCFLNTILVRVEDGRKGPVINFTQTPQSSCKSTGNGTISINNVDGGKPLGDYEFEWYQGNNTFVELPTVKVSAHKTYDLDKGQYTLRVINKSTGCITDTLIEITEQLDNFEIKQVALKNQTTCIPANGEISVNVDPDVSGPETPTTTGYKFEWWKGESVTTDAPYKTDAAITGLAAGKYIVKVTSNNSGCSFTKVFTIGAPALPTVTITKNNNQTSCDLALPNGKLTAAGAPTSGFTYSYQWYKGDGTSSEMVGYTSSVADNLAEGTYTVKVTNDQTGCWVTGKGKVESSPVAPPVISVAPADIKPQTFCADPANGGKPDGEAKATIGGTTPANIEFRWYNGDLNLTQIKAKTSPDFTGAHYQNLAAGKYTVVAVDLVNHCISDPFVVTISDNTSTINITISVTNSTGTDCLDGIGSELSANATVGGASPAFVYKWYKGSPETSTAPYFSSSTPVINPTDLEGKVISNITPSRYTVVVQNLATGCWKYKIEDLGSASPIPSVKLNVTDNSICPNPNGDGKVSIDLVYKNKAIDPTDVVDDPNVLANYDVYFFKGSTRPATLTALNKITFDQLTEGFYTVFVKEKGGNGCESYLETVEVKSTADMKPVIDLAQEDPRTNCDPATPNGSLSLTISNPQGGDFSKYTYSLDGGVTETAFTALTVTIPGMRAQEHTVLVKNTNSGCTVTAKATINQADVVPIPEITVNAVNTSCLGNGVLEIDLADYDISKYIYRWYRASGNVEIGDKTGEQRVLTGLDSGSYYLMVQDKSTFCSTTKIERKVLDNRIIPAVNVKSITPQTICNNAFGYDGTVTITLSSGTTFDDPADYVQPFLWKFNGSLMATAPTLTGSGNEFTASGLAAGNYSLEVKSAISDCPTVIAFGMYNQFDLPEVTALATDKTVCLPFSDAQASVNATNPAGLTTFNWSSVVNGTETPLATTTSIDKLEPGEYTVRVTDTKGCTSYPYQVTIKDNTPKPQIQLVDFLHQSNCDSIMRPNGMLQISTLPYGNYSYQWTSLRGLPVMQVNDTTLKSLRGGTYQVTVTDDNTGCFFLESFTIKDSIDVKTPFVSVANNTNCSPYQANGVLTASVDGGNTGYSFLWFKGPVVKSTPDFTTAEISGLAEGEYTLVLVDNVTTCSLAPITYRVGYTPVPINIRLEEENPVTNCDYNERPNGQVRASANNKLSGYQFDWYLGSTANSSASLFSSGITAEKLMPVPYTLRVTDLTTGCIKDTTFTPSLALPVIPAPDVDSVKHLTNCISPNGYVEVSVGGNTSHYIFKWYKGEEVKSTPDHIGHIQGTLDYGQYLVTATNKVSMCTSLPRKVYIIDQRVYVDFEVFTKNSVCNQNNGEASITWIQPVGISNILITNGTAEFNSDVNYGMPYGEFDVTVETMEGCATTKKVKIGVDYFVYNGVSVNGDGSNDIFEIECINLFPNNTVKIYNRAGALVYEGKGYDNETIYFAGFGNKGIYTTGNQLPDGTYYYLVDTGEGGKPKAGFIELLR
ncbi:MAG TPA: gliding motility-associated C-terminal domain-containing protein [Cytophagales bacterium]|nr:gliding motility-associated C-terminal domain-containing protein [Cytophagales bacterium]